jgi:hypothetical protein
LASASVVWGQLGEQLDEPDPWYGWNASREEARRLLRGWRSQHDG